MKNLLYPAVPTVDEFLLAHTPVTRDVEDHEEVADLLGVHPATHDCHQYWSRCHKLNFLFFALCTDKSSLRDSPTFFFSLNPHQQCQASHLEIQVGSLLIKYHCNTDTVSYQHCYSIIATLILQYHCNADTISLQHFYSTTATEVEDSSIT